MEFLIIYTITVILSLTQLLIIDFKKTGNYYNTTTATVFSFIPFLNVFSAAIAPFDNRITKDYTKLKQAVYFLPLLSLGLLYFI